MGVRDQRAEPVGASQNRASLNPGRRRNEASWEAVREERLVRLLGIAAQNYSGRAMGVDDLMRDAILLERELLRALKRWKE